MISAIHTDNQRAWFQRIMQEGCSSRSCKRFVIISGIAFFVVRGLMAVYQRCRVSEEIATIQLEELWGYIINQDQTEDLATKKPTDTPSV